MKRLLILLVGLGLFCGAGAGLAQDDVNTIEYGQEVSGEITNRSFEIEYRFTGSEGDVILAEMKPVQGASPQLDSPAIMLLSADYSVLGTVDGYSQGAVFLAQLPLAGEYSLLATRRDGRGGAGIGAFTLRLTRLLLLEDGKTVGGKIHPQNVDYYAAETGNPFAVTYERKTRGFYPEVRIALIGDYGLEEIASLRGRTLVSGAIGIAPESPDSQLYIVMIESSSYYGDPQETVEYDITLNE